MVSVALIENGLEGDRSGVNSRHLPPRRDLTLGDLALCTPTIHSIPSYH
jgi:hypothetical protein